MHTQGCPKMLPHFTREERRCCSVGQSVQCVLMGWTAQVVRTQCYQYRVPWGGSTIAQPTHTVARAVFEQWLCVIWLWPLEPNSSRCRTRPPPANELLQMTDLIAQPCPKASPRTEVLGIRHPRPHRSQGVKTRPPEHRKTVTWKLQTGCSIAA